MLEVVVAMSNNKWTIKQIELKNIIITYLNPTANANKSLLTLLILTLLIILNLIRLDKKYNNIKI